MPTSPTNLTLFGHLEELRKRLLISVGALFLTTAASFFYADSILSFLLEPVQKEIGNVYFFSPAEAFIIKIKVAFISGVLIASPVLASQIWLFMAPGLYAREKNIAIPLVLTMSFLFLAGALFSFFFVMPLALQFLIGMRSDVLLPMISVAHYIDFLFGMLLAFGAAFNLPVLILLFVLLGVISSKQLFKYQRHMIVVIFITAAIITPGPDIASQLLLAAPLILLFELSVCGAKLIELLKRKPVKSLKGSLE